jgi:hypothetical protein
LAVKIPEVPIVEVGKKCQVILHYLGMTLHHQALRYAVNNNAKQISKKFGIASKQLILGKFNIY